VTPRPTASRAFDHFEEAVAGTALVVVVLAACWGVVTRYVTAQPATWTGEVAAIAFAWLVFVGAAAGFKYGMHVAIDMVVALVPASPRRWLMAAADGLVIVFLATLLVLAIEFSIDAWGDPTSVLRLPRSVTYASVVVGSLCMLVRYLRVAWRRWNGLPLGWLEVPGPADAAL
jgi:TRAP-type C4-dicarboxylate transport system permease small subunit